MCTGMPNDPFCRVDVAAAHALATTYVGYHGDLEKKPAPCVLTCCLTAHLGMANGLVYLITFDVDRSDRLLFVLLLCP